jgi:hypothetical protein
MKDYKNRVSYLELITKCVFDSIQALEHLVAHATAWNLDVHNIVFFGSSAGAAEVNYLTWVYHRWNHHRYTPVGMILTTPQLDLPVFGAVGRIWRFWDNHSHPDAYVKEIIQIFGWCERDIGNVLCVVKPGSESNPACNRNWQKLVVERFCSSPAVFNNVTIAQLHKELQWSGDVPEVDAGIKVLWYTSQNMMKYQPKRFHLFLSHVSRSAMTFDHSPTYIVGYVEQAILAGINFTAYYGHYPYYPGLSTQLPSPFQRLLYTESLKDFPATLNYHSSVPWRERDLCKVTRTAPSSVEEHLLFICQITGLSHCAL